MTPDRAREIAEQAWSGLEAGTKDGEWNTPIIAAILLAVEEERARCAEICEQHASAEGIAQRIRAQIVSDP